MTQGGAGEFEGYREASSYSSELVKFVGSF